MWGSENIFPLFTSSLDGRKWPKHQDTYTVRVLGMNTGMLKSPVKRYSRNNELNTCMGVPCRVVKNDNLMICNLALRIHEKGASVMSPFFEA
jgi:hypothetical protein